jgi:ribA/ribD-fused uncharacterized protein
MDPTGVYFFSKTAAYAELSNYWTNKNGTPLFYLGDQPVLSVEHAFQFYKFFYTEASPTTLEYAQIVLNAPTPNQAKLLGGQKERGGFQSGQNATIQQYKGQAIMNPQWDNIKVDIMSYILRIKFTQSDHCRAVLLSTRGRMLYEDSPYDSFWGIGRAKNGQNHLGKRLVQLRDALIGTEILPQAIVTGDTQLALLAALKIFDSATSFDAQLRTDMYSMLCQLALEYVGARNAEIVIACHTVDQTDVSALMALIQLLTLSITGSKSVRHKVIHIPESIRSAPGDNTWTGVRAMADVEDAYSIKNFQLAVDIIEYGRGVSELIDYQTLTKQWETEQQDVIQAMRNGMYGSL